MSAWILGLALGAGFLINKNIKVSGLLDSAERTYNSAAAPSTDGATSAEVRNAWANTDFTKFGDMHQDLPASQKMSLASKTEDQRALVQSYDTPPGSEREIRGVFLTFDRPGPS